MELSSKTRTRTSLRSIIDTDSDYLLGAFKLDLDVEVARTRKDNESVKLIVGCRIGGRATFTSSLRVLSLLPYPFPCPCIECCSFHLSSAPPWPC